MIKNRSRSGVISIILTILAASTTSLCATYEVGGDPYAFLTIGVGARAIGMGGGSFVAIADDATAAYWNPAGLGILTKREIIMMGVYSMAQSDDESASGIAGQHGYLSLCYPTKMGNPGVSANFFQIGDIQQTRATDYSDYEFVEAEAFSDQQDIEGALNASYGIALPYPSPEKRDNSWIFIGAGLRLMRQQFLGFSTNGWGWDMGFIIRARAKENGQREWYGVGDPRIGYVFRYNSDRKWNGENVDEDYSDPSTVSWQLGAALDPVKQFLTTALAITNTSKGSPLTLSAGMEFRPLKNVLAIRAGVDKFRIQKRNSSEAVWDAAKFKGTYAAGIGVNLKVFQIDYVFAWETLAIKHRASLAVRF